MRPAAFCGVVGFKPSFGAIPRTGVRAFAGSLDHVGTFTRGVADAALLTGVLFGRDGIDLPHAPRHPAAWPLRPLTDAPRIALLRTAAWSRADAAQRVLVESVAERLAAAGATLTSIALPTPFDDLWSVARTICEAEGAVMNASLAHETVPRISAATIELVARGEALSVAQYLHAKAAQQTMIGGFAALMAPFDVVLTAPALGEAPLGLADTGDAVFCTPFSLVGGPAIALPAGFGPNGLPLGVQLASTWGDDRRLLETAAWVEATLAWRQGFPAP